MRFFLFPSFFSFISMMHNALYTTGFGNGFILAWAVHVLAVILFSIGILFLVLWAVKKLTPAQLRTWGIGLAVAGAILCFSTVGMISSRTWGGNMMDGRAFSPGMIEQTFENDDDFMHSMMGNGGMGMSMNGMSMMLQGKTGDEFDAAFITMMIPHHQGAIDMANDALKNAKHEELKQLARDIIASQQREIDMMKSWQEAWGY